jgi:hypothetical protein
VGAAKLSLPDVACIAIDTLTLTAFTHFSLPKMT